MIQLIYVEFCPAREGDWQMMDANLPIPTCLRTPSARQQSDMISDDKLLLYFYLGVRMSGNGPSETSYRLGEPSAGNKVIRPVQY